MTLLRNKIFEDCVKAEAHNPVKIIDVAIQRFEMLIDEMIQDYTNHPTAEIDEAIGALEELKEKLKK